MNDINKEPLTDYNYEKVLDRAFATVPNNSIAQTKEEPIVLDTDFMTSSNNFWLSHEGGKLYPIYHEGIMGGTYNARQPSFKAITETFTEALKNIIRIQSEKEDKTPEVFSTYIQMIEKSFELLVSKLDSTLDEKMQGELIMAYLHATFNSFITTNITKKD